jgi:hypothetical protein
LYSDTAPSDNTTQDAKRLENDLDGALDETGGEEMSPRSQAEEMVRLMHRSILLHELKERALWDEDLDPNGAAQSRIQLSSISSLEEEGRIVREWIEDTLNI